MTGHPERTASGPGQRALLACLLLAFGALALNASALLPLWEPPGEASAVREAQAWAGGGHAEPGSWTGRAEPSSAVLPRALLAAGLRLAGLQDTVFLARPNRPALPGDVAQYLHGPDERMPWRGPARSLHGLRLLSVLFGLAAVLGAHALARRFVPDRPGVALLAAALCAFHPPFLVATASLGGAAPATALATWSLVALADFARGPLPSARRGVLAGVLLGLSLLAGVPGLMLVPLAPLALLLAARGASWREALRPLDALAAGFLLMVGPVLAWRWVSGAGEAAGLAESAGSLPLAAVVTQAVPLLAFGFIGLATERLAAGPPVLLAWSTLAAVGALGLILAALRGRRGRSLADGRVTLLLLATLLLALLAALADGIPTAASGLRLLPATAAVSALLATGCAAWLPAGRPRLARAGATLLAATLAAVAGWHQAYELGPAFHPLNRLRDPHLLCFDPLAAVPESHRQPTVAVVQPRDGESLRSPPVLRWTPVTDPRTRYSVHLLTPGSAFAVRTFEDTGLSLRDRYEVPAELWDHVPPGVDLVLRAVRLPTLDEALDDAPLLVDETAGVRVRREQPGVMGGRH